MILKLKNGSGIHIKKKNRGKFTAYCGGNVTSACIAKAKASGNPTLVKRATFAANARKWKHLKGGTLYKYQVGGYVLPQNVQESISNGSASAGILQGFGKVMERVLPTWLLKAGTYVSPLNYAAAISKGSINPKIGEEVVSTWHPNLLLVARLGEIIGGGKAIKGTGKAVVNTAAKAGNKTARAYLISKEINKGIKENTKNGRIEVSPEYFKAEDKWYRLSERPEKIGIEELGKNITTHDDPEIPGTIGNWRSTILDNRKGLNGKSKRIIPKPDNGFVLEEGMNFAKHGLAHGNTSQAAKGLIWEGTFAFSNRFPGGIIEGQAPNKIFRGMTAEGKDSRSNFVLLNWKDVPIGARVGFHTGEMPMENLGWFLKLPNEKYTYEPIIPLKRIQIEAQTSKLPRQIKEGVYPVYRGPQFSIKSVVNPDGTVNPRLAMKVLHAVADWYKLFGEGAYRMEERLENPVWHKTDPTTYHHTKNVALSAWGIDVPVGFTKLDQMVAAVGHDFGKMVSGDGHAQIGADLLKLVFPDMTEALYKAIAEHMELPITPLGKVTKQADRRNGIVVRNINGKTRILLPIHNDAKPREIVLEPKGNNKYFVHMRFWDDVKNQVPGHISNIEKSNLFLTLYETLPDGAEILFPESGPGNYATRGTVAGLQRLSRDPRFSPGTPGTLLYKGKNNTILTYQGTSFIKKPLNKYSRKPIYVSISPWEAPDLIEYPEYVKMRGEKLKKIAPDKILDYTPDTNNPLDLFMILEEGFHPMYKMTPGTNLKALLNENIRRLRAIYGDSFTDAHALQMKLKGSAPYYLGYFDDSGTSGLHNVKRNLNMIELNPYSKLHTDMMHEGIMHGTDNFLTDYTASLYLNFIDKIINSPEILYKNGVPHYKWLGINTRPVPEGTDIWYEGRSTFGELRKAMYDNIAKNKGTKVTEDTFETLRPEFEKQVDKMELEDASKALIRTNPYGDVYGNVGPKVNPNFLSEFKGLLKYAPISIPFIFSTDKKKKGGKLCLIPRN